MIYTYVKRCKCGHNIALTKETERVVLGIRMDRMQAKGT